MRGDFTRDTAMPARQYTAVLMQQGRVQLDSDWNEQVAIQNRYQRTVLRDLVGDSAGPRGRAGFGIVSDVKEIALLTTEDGQPLGDDLRKHLVDAVGKGDFVITAGRYYVDGLLCSLARPMLYSEQIGYPAPAADLPAIGAFPGPDVMFYLDVWERTAAGVDETSLLEPALGGPDTAVRSELVIQVKVRPANVPSRSVRAKPQLRARTVPPGDQLDACVVDPAARYRGPENQLYRVEIHHGGPAEDATLKWSRENGSVAFRMLQDPAPVDGQAAETAVRLSDLGPDKRLGLAHGDLVEIGEDLAALRGPRNPLLAVDRIDPDESTVILSGRLLLTAGPKDPPVRVLRRWDHRAEPDDNGTIPVVESATNWIDLEDGIQIQFVAATGYVRSEYAPGDYWLIPARVATGDVIWPRHQDDQGNTVWEPRTAAGTHHYADVLSGTVQGQNPLGAATEQRRLFSPVP